MAGNMEEDLTLEEVVSIESLQLSGRLSLIGLVFKGLSVSVDPISNILDDVVLSCMAVCGCVWLCVSVCVCVCVCECVRVRGDFFYLCGFLRT